MSSKSENGIKVLQNVTLKSNCVESISQRANFNINCRTLDNDKENSVESIRKRRYTASSYIFDEEPVFSDSSEEEEYCKNILATQKCLDCATPKKLEVQCNLSADDLRIMGAIKECASINVENVNSDFKQLINMCKELEIKYITLSTSEIVTKNNGLINKEAFAGLTLTEKNLKNVQESIPIMEYRFPEEKLIPSKSGSSGICEAFSFDSGFSNVSFLTPSLSNEEKENTLRRSSRIRKPLKAHNLSGTFITGKNRQLLERSQRRVKTKNIRVKQKIDSKILSCKKNRNIRKQKQVNKAVSTVQIGRNEERNIKQENKSLLVKPMKPKRMVSLNDSWDDIFQVKALFLPKKQIRCLARNWMKTNKDLEKRDLSGDNDDGSVSMQQKQKLRRLYSPDEWMHSPEFESLYKK